ncbi:MAG: ParB/Srx family N-terminal domain-containing protein [Chloroflexota bacterium]|nr:ParB/Srx family N-terminal domain-containing protein [Chloroflexota bacterium]
MDGIISDQLSPIELSIDQIYLDPNNPRFVDDDWQVIRDDSIELENVQREALDKMVRFHDVNKLRMNMEINGFLPIDQVIVREFKSDRYVVLEGNRRISAAKLICHQVEKGVEIGPAVIASIRKVNCLLYTGSDNQAAWTFQGLRHITGIKPWSAYNKAKLMNQLLQEEDRKLGEIGKQFGLTAFGAGQWIRGYNAFRQAKDESEYSHDIKESAYTYFQELFGHSNLPLRKWMDWNDNKYRFEDSLAFSEFLSWLYPKPGEEELDDDRDPHDIQGNWDDRRILTNRGLRDVSYLLKHATPHFEAFRNGADLTKAVATARLEDAQEEADSRKQPAKELLRNMDELTRELHNIPTLKFKSDDKMREQLLQKIAHLQEAISDVNYEFQFELSVV